MTRWILAAAVVLAACSGDTGEQGSAETASDRVTPNVGGTDPTGGVGNNAPQNDPGINTGQQSPGAGGDTGAASPRLNATGTADANPADSGPARPDSARADSARPR